jgi:hypothetical protein
MKTKTISLEVPETLFINLHKWATRQGCSVQKLILQPLIREALRENRRLLREVAKCGRNGKGGV